MLFLNILSKALENNYFREVIFTSESTQLVVMAIEVEDEIGEEIHHENDQLLIFVEGEGEARIDEETRKILPGDAFLVPKGTKHNFINTGSVPLKLFTTYSPPHHPDGTIHKTKKDSL